MQPLNSYRMPTWFIPHGAGPCFFMDWSPPNVWNLMGNFLKEIVTTLPIKPRAIIVVSAHWLESEIAVTGGAKPELIYDYYGFPEHTYSLKYPAMGSPLFAQDIVSVLTNENIAAKLDNSRGFDHGMFIPMMLMFPEADIPVVQVSLNSNLSAQEHLNLGEALAKFRDDGVLIIGSGMSFHNMRGYGNPQFGPISEAFDAWLTQTVSLDAKVRRQGLLDWEKAPHARLCHPFRQEEHLLPLMVVAGAALEGVGQKIFSDHVLETKISAYAFS